MEPRHQRRLGTAWMVKHQAEEHHHPCWCTLISIYLIPALSFPTAGALVPCELSSGVQPGVLVSWLKTLEFHLVFGEKPDDAQIGSGRYLCEALMFSSDLNIGTSHGDKKKLYFAPVSWLYIKGFNLIPHVYSVHCGCWRFLLPGTGMFNFICLSLLLFNGFPLGNIC